MGTAKDYSYESLISRIKKYSTRDTKLGLTTLDVREILNEKDKGYGVFEALKSNNTSTLFLGLRTGNDEDYWFFFCPNDNHIFFLTEELPQVYKIIDDHNKISMIL
jgi:hypothetical protein